MPRSGRRLSLLALVVAPLLVVSVACADDGPTIDKAQLLSQGDEICRERLAALQEQALADPDLTESQIIQQVLLPGLRSMFEEVQALGTPSGDGDALEDLYTRLFELIADLGQGEATAAQGQLAAIEAELEDYGFEECSQVGG